jgi:hypothetical protein
MALNQISLFETAQEEIGDYYWMSGGPWLDAQDEESLADAIWHCESCCDCVVADLEGYGETEYIPLNRDLVFLHYIKESLEYSDKNGWLPEVEQMITFITLQTVA